MSITSIHREQHKTMNLNQSSSINSNIYTWVFLHSSLHALALPSPEFLQYNDTIHNEGVYIPLPSCILKQSNLELNFYLPALTTLNVVYLLRTRAKGSRFDSNIQVCFILMTSFKMTHQLQSDFQKLCWRLSSCLSLLHWLT
jgi:hypothetical protein